MAIIENIYTGDGATVLFSFTFPYIDPAHVKVSLDGVATTAYSLANATTVEMDAAPANGVVVRVYRSTDFTGLAATFYPGSSIRAADLNDNLEQVLFLSQEADFASQEAKGYSEALADDAALALVNASTALSTANAAEATANAIAGNASTALSTAQAAEATANGIAATANTALSTANSASAAATSAVNTANAISGTATDALNTANSATSTANAAQSTANAALPKAGGTISGNVDSSATGYFDIPSGTTAQRPGSPNTGMIRYNTDTNQFEGYSTAWDAIGAGAKGASGNQVFFENDQTVSANYTITSGKNAMTAGPVTIGDGIVVTVPSGSSWSIV